MRHRAIFASIILVLGVIPLWPAPEEVFLGIPTVKVVADGTKAESTRLSAADREKYVCRIVSEGGRFFWASRANNELSPSISGIFILYTALDGSGLIKVLYDRNTFGGDYDYLEQTSAGLSTISYWGERARSSNVQMAQRMLQDLELAHKNPEVAGLYNSLKDDLLAIERALGSLSSAYKEIDFKSIQESARSPRTLEQIRRLRTAGDSLTEAVQKYQQRLASVIAGSKVKFTAEESDRIKSGIEAASLIAGLGKKVADSASIYLVSLAEKDRLKLAEAQAAFEAEWKLLQKRAQANDSKIESLTGGKGAKK